MQARELAKIALSSTRDLLNAYLSDLSDNDLRTRPVPNANHAAWQMAHLIGSEKRLLESLLPGVQYPELPASILRQSSGNSAATQADGDALTRTECLEWFGKIRSATLAAVEKISDADLDRPNNGVMREFAPNLGAMLILIANHTLMHGGQFTVLRRALNKPVLF